MPTDSADGQTAAGRVASLTGMRAVAAMLVVGTHAAFGTGMLSHGYLGLALARLEVGVSIFFVLSGFLLFRPWGQAAVNGRPRPSVRRYARHRVRRIMPAYVVTVLAAFVLYQFRTTTPNPGHTWPGLVRHLTLTQIYSNDYLTTQLHQGLTQMWSLAVEAAFYVALPALAYGLLIVLCRGRWRPGLLLVALSALIALTPIWLLALTTTDWLPNSAGMWLPSQLMFFAGGMLLAVLQAMGVRSHAFAVIPVAIIGYLIVSTPIAGEFAVPLRPFQPVCKAVLYCLVATLAVAPLALGANSGAYARLLGSRPMVWLGGISYEIFLLHVMLMEIALTSVLHWHVFTGSLPVLFAVTLALTVPLAWLLRRFSSAPGSASAADTRWNFLRRPSHPRTAASPAVPRALTPDSAAAAPILRPAGVAVQP
jgi:peptidoglycan/LPS O-acetylase OafA/YrhL